MNDHHVYDWIDEAETPKGTKVESSRWLDDIHVTVMRTAFAVALLCNSTMLTNASMFIRARYR